MMGTRFHHTVSIEQATDAIKNSLKGTPYGTAISVLESVEKAVYHAEMRGILDGRGLANTDAPDPDAPDPEPDDDDDDLEL